MRFGAYKAGWDAYDNGADFRSNPHDYAENPEGYDAWMSGWYDAELDHEHDGDE